VLNADGCDIVDDGRHGRRPLRRTIRPTPSPARRR
jgi:hypothetical protein